MTGFVRFLHLLTTAAWFGGALAAMTLAVAARREGTAERAYVAALIGRLYSRLIGPAAAVSLLSGLALTMMLAIQGFGPMLASPRLVVMQGAGLVAGILVLFLGLPTALKLGRLGASVGSGELPSEFDELRKRQGVVQSVAGLLMVIAFYAVAAL
jgi:putative copper export protein